MANLQQESFVEILPTPYLDIIKPNVHPLYHSSGLSIVLFRKQPWKEEHMVTTILILSLLEKDKKRILGPGDCGASGGLRSTLKEQQQMGMSPLLLSSLLSSVDATSSLQDGTPSHHHTVHLGSAAPCIHCSRNKRPPLVRQGRSKEGKSRPRPGETTVFSVGR